jgi:hypothetical protein
MDSQTPDEDDRLEALRELLAEIANGIRVAQESLSESENLSNTAYVVADSLGRLGWLADQGCVVAGDDFPPCLGDARAWLRIPLMAEDAVFMASDPRTEARRQRSRQASIDAGAPAAGKPA